MKRFAKFLAQCLTFTLHLRRIDVLVDGAVVKTMERNVRDVAPIGLPKSSFWSSNHCSSVPHKIFELQSVESCAVDFVSGDRKETFKRVSATLGVTLPRALAEALKRITKKRTPRTVRVQMLMDMSDSANGDGADGLSPRNSGGRVFIGFCTQQTTGTSCHISAGALIPTVERESIDFNDPVACAWNKELVFSLGLLMRIVHESTCSTSSDAVDIVRCMSAFSQRASTPAKAVGLLLQCGFFSPTIAGVAPSVYTMQRGAVPASEARLPRYGIEAFISPESKTVAVIPSIAASSPGAASFLEELIRRGLLREIGMRDLLVELKQRVLTHNEVVLLLRWLVDQKRSDKHDATLSTRLQSQRSHTLCAKCGTVLVVPQGGCQAVKCGNCGHHVKLLGGSKSGKSDPKVSLRELLSAIKVQATDGELPVALTSYSWYTKIDVVRGVPEELLLDTMLPPFICDEFSASELDSYFSSWLSPMKPIEWTASTAGIVAQKGDAALAEAFIVALADVLRMRAFRGYRQRVVGLLKTEAIVPTSIGVLLQPNESYLNEEASGGFSNLPVVSFPARRIRALRSCSSILACARTLISK